MGGSIVEEKHLEKKKAKGFGGLVSVVESIYSRANISNDTAIDENRQFVQYVNQAYEEWQDAEKLFHSVNDPDLIDHAIYKIEATKARYIYLLKQAKANGIRTNFH